MKPSDRDVCARFARGSLQRSRGPCRRDAFGDSAGGNIGCPPGPDLPGGSGACVTVLRQADPEIPELAQEETLECRLVGIKQYEGTEVSLCPVEHLLLLKGCRGLPPAAQRMAVKAADHLEQVRAFLHERIARDIAMERKRLLEEQLPARESLLKRGFDFQETDRISAFIERTSDIGQDKIESYKSTLDGLLEFADKEKVLWWLYKYFVDLDSGGQHLIPLLVSRIQTVPSDSSELGKWAAFAGYYGFDTPMWRGIASVACGRANKLARQKDRWTVYSSLLSKEGESWSGAPGVLHPRWQEKVDKRRVELDNESDAALVPFREWHLGVVEAELERAKRDLEEEDWNA